MATRSKELLAARPTTIESQSRREMLSHRKTRKAFLGPTMRDRKTTAHVYVSLRMRALLIINVHCRNRYISDRGSNTAACTVVSEVKHIEPYMHNGLLQPR